MFIFSPPSEIRVGKSCIWDCCKWQSVLTLKTDQSPLSILYILHLNFQVGLKTWKLSQLYIEPDNFNFENRSILFSLIVSEHVQHGPSCMQETRHCAPVMHTWFWGRFNGLINPIGYFGPVTTWKRKERSVCPCLSQYWKLKVDIKGLCMIQLWIYFLIEQFYRKCMIFKRIIQDVCLFYLLLQVSKEST